MDRKQKILIVDVNTLAATIYKKEFRVLHFDSFIDNHLKGIDSPLYKSDILDFNLKSQEVAGKKNLNPRNSCSVYFILNEKVGIFVCNNKI